MERGVAGASKLSFANHKCSHDPSRVIGVMRAHDFPRVGLTTAVSFGLAHETWPEWGFPDRMELVQVWDDPSLEYERLLVTAVESVLILKRPPKPGVIYEKAVVAANLPLLMERMPNALMLYPYLWDDGLVKVQLGQDRVWFLQVVPIFDDEMTYIEKQKFEKFEELLSYDGADFEFLNRLSHVSR